MWKPKPAPSFVRLPRLLALGLEVSSEHDCSFMRLYVLNEKQAELMQSEYVPS